ncbi:MAG: hypothetical protein ACKO7Y_04140 [Candidatus Nitrosotenuis sp.]
MANEEIKRLVKESVDKLHKQCSDDVSSINEILSSFKKKTLSKI